MTEQQFQSEMGRAETMRRLTANPAESEYYAGYIRGLRRAYHGESFGTEEEHTLRLSLTEDKDPARAAKGRGYRDGLDFGKERIGNP
jgi:hypothetical protein